MRSCPRRLLDLRSVAGILVLCAIATATPAAGGQKGFHSLGEALASARLDLRHAKRQLEAVVSDPSRNRRGKIGAFARVLAGNLGLVRPRPVVVMNGTFDPIHEGHVFVAESARDQLGAQTVIIAPGPKSRRKTPLPLEHRLAMAKLAIEGHPSLAVADPTAMAIFAEKGQAALVDHIDARYPGARIYLVVGTDLFTRQRDDGWIDLQRKAGRRPVIVSCQGYAKPEQVPSGVEVLDDPGPKQSSTVVKQQLQIGPRIRIDRFALAVLDYIRDHGLYFSAERAAARVALPKGKAE